MAVFKIWLKHLLPPTVLRVYYRWLSRYAAWRYHNPSQQLIVIGITGTKGKSSTSNLVWHLLTQAGYKVGMATTANFRIGDQHWLNTTKMTMLGRTQLQKFLSQVVAAGCTHVIVETSSEGIIQYRHYGINYDCAVITNLFPEHIEAHGSFENYKQAKLELFRHLTHCSTKMMNGKTILKGVVMNGEFNHVIEFMQAVTDVGVGGHPIPTRIIWSSKPSTTMPVTMQISDVSEQSNGLVFTLGSYQFYSPLLGRWNIENIASALGVGVYAGMSLPDLVQALSSFHGTPGRMEFIDEGQSFKVIVDYAYEPRSLRLLYNFWRKQVGEQHKLITLISSTGGGRDQWRRAENGKVAAELCDYVFVTDEDPYDDDPEQIIMEVARGALAAGKVEGKNLWKVRNRYHAMQQAIQLAQSGDIVLFTAKGADQKMCLANGKKIDWDDRELARQILRDR